ncbi:MAG: hypothetical protein L3K00_07985 [Thermoplasmata archaeon]|nr:hypothetical protein [Thermoplasmata archaeon]
MGFLGPLSSAARRVALLGAGSGLAVVAVVTRGSNGGLLQFVPANPGSLTAVALPVVSLLALVGPTGLTFPCWAVESTSPGARLLRWVRRNSRR